MLCGRAGRPLPAPRPPNWVRQRLVIRHPLTRGGGIWYNTRRRDNIAKANCRGCGCVSGAGKLHVYICATYGQCGIRDFCFYGLPLEVGLVRCVFWQIQFQLDAINAITKSKRSGIDELSVEV